MIAIQLVSAEIGRVTGKGIAANAKDIFPRWAVLALVLANTINIAADINAMGEALYLVIGGLKHEHTLIFAAVSVLLPDGICSSRDWTPYCEAAPIY